MDSQGQIVWSKNYSDFAEIKIGSMSLTIDSNLALYASCSSGYRQHVLITTDLSGNILSSNQYYYIGAPHNLGYNMQSTFYATEDTAYVLLGKWGSYGNIYKYDSYGNMFWGIQNGYHKFSDIISSDTNNLFIIGLKNDSIPVIRKALKNSSYTVYENRFSKNNSKLFRIISVKNGGYLITGIVDNGTETDGYLY